MRRLSLGVAVLLAAGVAAGPVGASGAVASADPQAGDPAHLAAVTQPVVQLVQIELKATVSSPGFTVNVAAGNALDHEMWAKQNSGQLARDAQSLNRQEIVAKRRDPDRYFVPTATQVGTTTLTVTCSGWFATPDGFLVTAAHCVQPDRAALLKQLEPVALASFIAQDKAVSLHNFRDIPLDEGMRADLLGLSDDWYARHAQLTALEVKVSVHVAVPGEAGRRGDQVTKAEVVSAGEVFPGRDVALLKVDGFDDLPSLALGDDARLGVGDTLYIDGYPGAVQAAAQLSEASRREPTFTQGPGSALRNTVNGVAYLQTQAPAYHGNSGGPVLDARGQVIGILVAGVADPQTGQAVEGQEFVLQRDGVAQELARHGVTAVSSRTTSDYAAALDDYERSYFSRAKAEFEKLRELHPRHPYAAWYVSLSAQQIEAGRDRTPGFPWLGVGMGLALVVIIGLLATVLLLLRRRPAPQPEAAAVAAAADEPAAEGSVAEGSVAEEPAAEEPAAEPADAPEAAEPAGPVSP